MVGRDLREREWGLLLIFSLQDEKVLELGYTTTGIYLTLLTSTLKNGYDGKFHMMWVFLATIGKFLNYFLKWGRGGLEKHSTWFKAAVCVLSSYCGRRSSIHRLRREEPPLSLQHWFSSLYYIPRSPFILEISGIIKRLHTGLPWWRSG